MPSISQQVAEICAIVRQGTLWSDTDQVRRCSIGNPGASADWAEQGGESVDTGGKEFDFLPASHLQAVGHVGVFAPYVAHEVVEKSR